jgi:purine nucleosidase
MTTEKVLLDTDIGSDIDDALALAYLLRQRRCELLGVTTVSGEPALRAELASAICCNLDRDDVPIHVGAAEPLLVGQRQPKATQAAALGSWRRRRDFAATNTAVEFLRETIRAHPGEVTLLTIGPLTNAALLLAIDPEISSMLKRIVLMCGQFFDANNGEWNALLDPHATAIVYGQGDRPGPAEHVSYGLDVTMKVTLDADECRRRFGAKALAPVRDFAEVWFADRPVVVFHDPLAAACIFEPEICRTRRGRVCVSTAEPTRGWTVARGDDGPHTLAAEVDAQRFLDHFFDVVD